MRTVIASIPQSELLERLARLRSTIRRRLIAYGVCAVAAGGIVSFLTVVMLDWFLWLPPALRVFVAVLFLAGFLLASWHWVHVPVRARLGLSEIAARLERHFLPLSDRLSSAVSFLENPDAGSPTMMRQVVVDTERLVGELALDEALTLRPFAFRAASLAVAVAALAAVVWLAPAWVQTGAIRFLFPFSGIEWPRRTQIVPLTGDRTAAVGESVTLRMQVQRGDHESLRGVVRVREPEGQILSLTMQKDADGTFYTTVDAVSKNLHYWFEAGDDTTESRPFAIRVVPRPEVVHATAVVEPPLYAPDRGPSVHDLVSGPITATVGGAVRITLRASKPIPPDPTGQRLGLRTDDGSLIPLSVHPDDAAELVARFDVAGDLRLRPEIRDEEGYENRGAATYEIRAVPDAPPTVTVVEPPAITELTAKGSVRIIARVTDDFGLADLSLYAEAPGGKPPIEVSLASRMRPTPNDTGVEAVAEYRWALESLGLSDGDTMEYTLSATDNFPQEGAAGQIGRSAPMRITIISETEFDTRLRSDIAVLEARVRQVALDQADLLDRTRTLPDAAGSEAGLSESQQQSASSLSRAEVRLSRRARELGQRFQKLAARLDGTESSDQEGRSRLLAIARALREAADDPMAEAGVALVRTAEASTPNDQTKAIQDAIRSEERAADRLQGLIRSMAQWGSFQGLVAKAGDLLERQANLRDETAALGKKMLGKPLDTLTPAEAADLKRILRRQEQLTADVEQFLERMAQLRTISQDKEPSAGEAIEAALRAARTHELSQRMQDASAALRGNRTAAATIDQKAASDALRKLASALREREERELAQLQKRLQQAEEQVVLLIQEQESLRAASNEAGLIAADLGAFSKLDVDQGRIRRNTLALAEEIGQAERAAQAARAIRQAAQPMAEAEGHLRTQKASSAVQAQDLALGALREAVDRLQRLVQDAANEVVRRSLAQIRDDLQGIRAAQTEVNQGIARLRTAIAGKDRLERAQTREASNLSRDQAAARALADSVVPDLDKVVVYRWAMERVTRWMDSARDALDARRINSELTASTDRIVAELDMLIRAILETEALPMSTDFAEADTGGEGSADAQGGKNIPTVAELLVLRGMQVGVNDRTGSQLADEDRGPTEEQLQDLKAIGEDQAEIRRLTELVTNRARQP